MSTLSIEASVSGPRMGFVPPGISISDRNRIRVMIGVIALVTIGLSLGLRSRAAGEIRFDWQNGLKFCVWVALVLWSIFRWSDLTPFLFRPAGFVIASMGCLALVSASWSQAPAYTAACALGFIAYTGLAGLAARDLSINTVLLNLLWSLAPFVGLALAAIVIWPDIAWLPPSVEENVYRLQGLAGSPNGLGHHAALYMIIAIACLSRGLISALAVLLHGSIGLLVVALTGDRTIVLAVLVALSVVACRYSIMARRAALMVTMMVAVTLLLYAAGIGPSLTEALRAVSRTGDANEILTLTGRTEIWSEAFNRLMERPIFGWGFNGTEEIMMSSMPKSFFGSAVNAHQMFLQLALSLGIVGFSLGFIIFLILVRAYIVRPMIYRDVIASLIFVNGLAEADVFATPVLTTFVLFWLLFADGPVNRPPVQSEEA